MYRFPERGRGLFIGDNMSRFKILVDAGVSFASNVAQSDQFAKLYLSREGIKIYTDAIERFRDRRLTIDGLYRLVAQAVKKSL